MEFKLNKKDINIIYTTLLLRRHELNQMKTITKRELNDIDYLIDLFGEEARHYPWHI